MGNYACCWLANYCNQIFSLLFGTVDTAWGESWGGNVIGGCVKEGNGLTTFVSWFEGILRWEWEAEVYAKGSGDSLMVILSTLPPPHTPPCCRLQFNDKLRWDLRDSLNGKQTTSDRNRKWSLLMAGLFRFNNSHLVPCFRGRFACLLLPAAIGSGCAPGTTSEENWEGTFTISLLKQCLKHKCNWTF